MASLRPQIDALNLAIQWSTESIIVLNQKENIVATISVTLDEAREECRIAQMEVNVRKNEVEAARIALHKAIEEYDGNDKLPRQDKDE